MVTITKENPDGTIINAESDDGRFEWFALQPGYIYDAIERRTIYQMAHMRIPGEGFGSDLLPESVAVEVRAFWAELNPLVHDRQEAAEQARIDREARELDKEESFQNYMDSQMDPEDR